MLALLLLIGDVIQGVASGRYRPHMDVIYMDVGQGDAALLRLPDGDGVLIDAGPRSAFSRAAMQEAASCCPSWRTAAWTNWKS